LIVFCVSCSKIGEAPERTFDISKESIDLSVELLGNWQRVCIITPYSNNQYAEEILGFKFDVENNSSILSSDGITLLITVKDNEVVEYFEVPRNNLDFSSLKTGKSRCYIKGNAKFKIIEGKAGWHSAQQA